MAKPLTRQQRWRRDHPRRYAAHLHVQTLRRLGVLTQQPCEVCGHEKSEAHHPDYDKPGQVQWLCRKHHRQLHARGDA